MYTHTSVSGICRQTSTTGLFDLAPVKGRQRLNRGQAVSLSQEEPQIKATTLDCAIETSSGFMMSSLTEKHVTVTPRARLERLSEADTMSSTESRSFDDDAVPPPAEVGNDGAS